MDSASPGGNSLPVVVMNVLLLIPNKSISNCEVCSFPSSGRNEQKYSSENNPPIPVTSVSQNS